MEKNEICGREIWEFVSQSKSLRKSLEFGKLGNDSKFPPPPISLFFDYIYCGPEVKVGIVINMLSKSGEIVFIRLIFAREGQDTLHTVCCRRRQRCRPWHGRDLF
jgi:hypothetical protein